MKGQGTIILNRKAEHRFSIKIAPKSQKDVVPQPSLTGYVAVEIGPNSVTFWGMQPGKLDPEQLETEQRIGYETTRKVAYWLSFNRDDRVLKYGKGYIMEATTLMEYSFLEPRRNQDKWNFLFDPQVNKTIEIVDNLTSDTRSTQLDLTDFVLLVDVEKTVNFYPYPLICDWPYAVKDSNTSTMLDISGNDYILSASLPVTCRELYYNVASAKVDLDWPYNTDVKLSEAIGYSIATPGKILYRQLKEKKLADEMPYLRVTLGCDHGCSPGIPYVLEIWPPKSRSPIHNHGNAYAVIKVLHGDVNIGIYNKTWPDSTHDDKPIKCFIASKGDVTWISPNWYQTHMLHNTSDKEYCATIQCYKYGDEDHLHWPYFDYLDGKDVKEFKPDSDFEFKDLRTRLLAEYRKDHC